MLWLPAVAFLSTHGVCEGAVFHVVDSRIGSGKNVSTVVCTYRPTSNKAKTAQQSTSSLRMPHFDWMRNGLWMACRKQTRAARTITSYSCAHSRVLLTATILLSHDPVGPKFKHQSPITHNQTQYGRLADASGSLTHRTLPPYVFLLSLANAPLLLALWRRASIPGK